MKYKKILFLIFLCIIIYTIYYFNHTDKINYLSLGDYLSVGIDSNGNTNYGYTNHLANYLKQNNKLKSFTNAFASSGKRIDDLLYNLETNQTVEKDNKILSLKKCIREADLITLSIGSNDILSKLTLSTTSIEVLSNQEVTIIADEILTDLEKLLKEIRKYSNKKIIFIGYYDPISNNNLIIERLYSYLITKTKKMAEKYNINYLDIYNLFKENKNYLPNPTNIHPSTLGYEAITAKIIENYLQK